MTKSKSQKSDSSSTPLSMVDEFLASATTKPLFTMPQDPKTFVHSLDDFPALSIFDISIVYPAIVVPTRQIPELRKKLSHVLLQRAKFKVVYQLDPSDPVPTHGERSHYRKMVLMDRTDIYEDPTVQAILRDSPHEFCRATHVATATYEDWTVEQVLRRLLPVKEIPSAFEIIGHLAHINLRDEVLPFKYILGKVVLDKNTPRIKTVVNKIGTIETEFRTFGMEVIAGNQEPGWSHVCVREEGCQYELDFTKVYWNSRLGGEHRRLVELIQAEAQATQSDIVVADLMAGIGPFAIPLTSKGFDNIHVHANDLNPSSHEYLVINAKKNKCRNLHCYNMDGRAFCHALQDKEIDFHHVLMNLPASAPEFLDAFRGFTGKILPRVHVHCFSKKDTVVSERDSIERCSRALGVPLDIETNSVVVHNVRNVAPNKNMYCVSFNLPATVRSLPRIQLEPVNESEEPESKRTKLI